MGANISLFYLLSLSKKKTPLIEEIEKHEVELNQAELHAASIKGELEMLKKKHAESLVIKWRDEIRGCMRRVDNGDYLFVTAQQIIECIEYKNSIVADRNIKNKVATTLSIMHKEGEIGRIESPDGSIYGHKTLFNNDLKTAKKQYRKLLP